MTAIRCWPRSPLVAIDRAQFSFGVGPFVPDRDTALLKPCDIGGTPEKPEELNDHGAQVHLLCRDHGKPGGEIEAHLVAEYRECAGARSIILLNTIGHDTSEKVVILKHDLIVSRPNSRAGQSVLIISRSVQGYRPHMADFDVDAMIERFKDRAQAVRDRPLPPVAGAERQRFIEQAQTDYTDFALVAGASWAVEDNQLVLRIPLGESS